MMSKEDKHSKICIIIIGYDGYKDVWPYFSYFFNNSDIKEINHVFVSSFELGPDELNPILSNNQSASERIKQAINSINSDYYLILLEDYLVAERNVLERIKSYVDFLESNQYEYLCLTNFITKLKGKRVLSNYYKMNIYRNYRLSLQPSIWSKRLLELIISNNITTLWDFENYLNSSNVVDDVEAFFPKHRQIKVINMVDKGEITRKAARLIKKSGLQKPCRKIKSIHSTLKIQLKNYLISLLPERFLHFLMNHKKSKNK